MLVCFVQIKLWDIKKRKIKATYSFKLDLAFTSTPTASSVLVSMKCACRFSNKMSKHLLEVQIFCSGKWKKAENPITDVTVLGEGFSFATGRWGKFSRTTNLNVAPRSAVALKKEKPDVPRYKMVYNSQLFWPM